MKTQLHKIRIKQLKNVLFVILLAIGTMSVAQENEQLISGQINSNDGPLFGASIILKGSSVGVMSDENGKFIFPEELQKDDVLVISYLGYKTYEATVTKDTRYIEPFLEDIAVVIVATMRTKKINQ
jgi:hypothetical protein